MASEEQKIRDVIQEWLVASKRGDLHRVLALTADDVLFTVPSHEPFGKAFFAEISRGQKDIRVEGTCETLEVHVRGDLGIARNHLRLSMTMPDGKVAQRSGYTLSVFKRDPEAGWQLWRDANMVGADKVAGVEAEPGR